MDYNMIKIREDMTKKGFHHKKAAYKLHRLLFSISLWPDWKMASEFANVGNYRGFLHYWLEPEIVEELMEDVRTRKSKSFEDSEIFIVMDNAYNRLNAGKNYLEEKNDDEDYDEDILKRIDEIPDPIMTEEAMFRFAGLEKELRYDFIIDKQDMLVDMERMQKRKPMLESGKYWIVQYDQIPLKSKLRPFVLLAKTSEDFKTLEGIIGIWPISYMKKRVDKIVPIPYKATREDLRFLEVEVVEAKGSHDWKFKSVERIYPETEPYELLFG